MSDFYKARLAATYTPLDGQEVALVRHNHLLAEPPTLEWSLQTASYEYIAHQWAGDLPTGNARLTLAAQPLVRANTRAALERKLRHLELTLNLNRTGTLLLQEAYTQGAPTLHTWWTAVIETANASPLPLDQAPPIPGAWGKLDLSIILTNPSLEDPLSRRIEEEPDGTQEDESTAEEPTGMPEPTWTPTDNFSVWTLDIQGMYAAPWYTAANNIRDALRSLGLTHVVEGGTTHTDLQEDWTLWQCPDNRSRQSYPLTAYFSSFGVSSSEILGAIDACGGYPGSITCTPGIPTHAAGWLLSLDMGEAFLINGVEITPPQDYHRLDHGVWNTALQHANLPLSAIGLHIGNGTPAPVHVYLMANQPGTAGEQITLQADGAGGQVSAPTLLLPTSS